MVAVEDKVFVEDALMRLRDSGMLVIVEGPKDEVALRALGIERVVHLRGNLVLFSEQVAAVADEVALLTDLDAEGKKLYGQLSQHLSRNGVRVDNKFRNVLFRHSTLRQIEGMVGYLGRNATD
ncbi:hypothetical protein AUJ68_03485 [Candidatus Woesearchaeota archaeon CG1_02_57_44]|nr:MAG: hypothetical protein AUJ68_03485 [Candidatus Woesearchaeota archaeon CG1_02_57_44]PIN70200.1 MAG: hypothetical protein COV94_01970 [Candidatus Woesearchaeota archaeon CG11_big_fil_rev_8_21_14_0_20_57_5]